LLRAALSKERSKQLCAWIDIQISETGKRMGICRKEPCDRDVIQEAEWERAFAYITWNGKENLTELSVV
jgi:hypothetical protein